MDIIYVIIFCVIPILILNYFSQKAGQEFLKLYAEKVDNKKRLQPLEFAKYYSKNQTKFWIDLPSNFLFSIQIMWKKYPYKSLNNLANKMRLYFLAQLLVILLNFFFLGNLLGF